MFLVLLDNSSGLYIEIKLNILTSQIISLFGKYFIKIFYSIEYILLNVI